MESNSVVMERSLRLLLRSLIRSRPPEDVAINDLITIYAFESGFDPRQGAGRNVSLSGDKGDVMRRYRAWQDSLQIERIDSLTGESRKDKLAHELIRRLDWDDMTETERGELIEWYMQKKPEYKDREKLYPLLKENKTGSVYYHINNVISYLSSYEIPVNPNLGMKSDADYYYGVLVPKAATMVYWYDYGKDTLFSHKRVIWSGRINTPNVINKTVETKDDVVDGAKRVVTRVEEDLSSGKYIFLAGGLGVAAIVTFGAVLNNNK